MKKILLVIIIGIFLISSISASTFGYNYLNGQTVNKGGNYSINVNNTNYFQGYTPNSLKDWIESLFGSIFLLKSEWNATNTSYIPYTGANQNINLSVYNMTLGGFTTMPIGESDIVWTTNKVGSASEVGGILVGTKYRNATSAGINILFQRARGTITSKFPLEDGDVIGSINVQGYNPTTGTFAGNNGKISFLADGNHSGNNRPTKFEIHTTESGQSMSAKLVVMGNGNVGIGTTYPNSTLQVIGNILTNGTINSTVDICIQGGNCLSNSSNNETNWNANFTAFNSSWSSITNTSYALTTDVNTLNGSDIGALLYWNGSKWIPTTNNDTYYNPTTGRIGLRTNSTTRTLNINGNIRFVPQTVTAPTVALAGAGAGLLNNGNYRYAVTFVTDEGDTSTHTLYSSTITVVDNTTNGKIQLTNIPLGDAHTTAREIYRTTANGNIYLLYRVTTMANNVDTTYLDNVADGSLFTADGFYRKPDEATARMYYDTKKIFEAGVYNTMMGYSAGQIITTGDSNTFLGANTGMVMTTGSSNLGVGYYALGANIGGGSNTAVGSASLDAETSGSWNTGVGAASLSLSNGGNSNTALGTLAGSSVTIGDQNLFLGYNMSSTTTGSRNIMIGYNLAGGSSPTASYELNIGDLIMGVLTGSRHINISGSLNVSGNIYSNGTINSTSDIGTNGNLKVDKNVNITGNLSVKRPYWNGYDNSTQNFLNTSAVQVINISNNNDFDSYGIHVIGNQNLTFDMSGDYLCMLSPEFFQNGGGSLVTFWYQKNGVDVRWTNSRYSMTNNEYHAPNIPFQFDITNPATDNIRFMWYSDSTNTQIYSSGALTSPTRPSVPGIILNCQKVSEVT